MRKRLAIFCDGTWNDLRSPHLTNVARLAKSVKSVDERGVRQIVYYDSGVGVASGVSRTADGLTRLIGGATGAGLDDKIENAYRFLVLNYEPGDEIFIFGFSRGAYTARSLAGLIRKAGILRRNHFDMTPKAMDLYRSKVHPADATAFRAAYAHTYKGRPIATGLEEVADEPPSYGPHDEGDETLDRRPAAWRLRGAFPIYSALARDSDLHADVSDEAKAVYRFMYLGLWDTVGSLGLPPKLPGAGRLNKKYAFHDTDVSGLVSSLRHAVAADEDRKSFDVTVVSNIRRLNADWAKSAGVALDDTPYENLPYQQRWFPGDHGAVGGGNPERGLSSRALLWIAEGAERAGLALDREDGELPAAEAYAGVFAKWRIRKDGSAKWSWEGDGLGVIGGYKDRWGPDQSEEVHESAWERYLGSEYFPRSLARFLPSRTCPPLYRWMRPLGLVWRGLRFALVVTVLLLLVAAAGVLAWGALLWLGVAPLLARWAETLPPPP